MKLSTPRFLTNLVTGAALSMAGAFNAFAQFDGIPDVVGNGGPTDLKGAIITVIQAVLNLLGLIAVVVVIVAGIRLVIGGQEEGQREKARNAILYAVIGLVIIVLAKVLIDFVLGSLGVGGGGTVAP